MKTNKYIFGTMLFCASAAFVGCSNSGDDNFMTSSQTEKYITSIKVGAPAIVQNAPSSQTRMTYSYDSGLNMAWEAGDLIRVMWTQSEVSKAAKYQAESSGETSTFSYSSGTKLTGGYPPYDITYGKKDDAHGALPATGKNVSWEQTQSGNDATTHLKDQYQAILKGVNTITDVTFSKDWAETKGGSFVQSSCIKFDLTLPIYDNLTSIKKIVVDSKQIKDATETDYSSFWNYTANTAVKQITLNFAGLTSISGNIEKYNLKGYFMLTPYGIRTNYSSKGNCHYKIKVYYGESETDYIYRVVEFTGANQFDDKTANPNGGKLYVIKLNSSGWKDSSNNDI